MGTTTPQEGDAGLSKVLLKKKITHYITMWFISQPSVQTLPPTERTENKLQCIILNIKNDILMISILPDVLSVYLLTTCPASDIPDVRPKQQGQSQTQMVSHSVTWTRPWIIRHKNVWTCTAYIVHVTLVFKEKHTENTATTSFTIKNKLCIKLYSEHKTSWSLP